MKPPPPSPPHQLRTTRTLPRVARPPPDARRGVHELRHGGVPARLRASWASSLDGVLRSAVPVVPPRGLSWPLLPSGVPQLRLRRRWPCCAMPRWVCLWGTPGGCWWWRAWPTVCPWRAALLWGPADERPVGGTAPRAAATSTRTDKLTTASEEEPQIKRKLLLHPFWIF
jgi:hypothetical protein